MQNIEIYVNKLHCSLEEASVRNVSFQIFLRWLINSVNSVNKACFPVSLGHSFFWNYKHLYKLSSSLGGLRDEPTLGLLFFLCRSRDIGFRSHFSGNLHYYSKTVYGNVLRRLVYIIIPSSYDRKFFWADCSQNLSRFDQHGARFSRRWVPLPCAIEWYYKCLRFYIASSLFSWNSCGMRLLYVFSNLTIS